MNNIYHIHYIQAQTDEYPDVPDYERHGFVSSMANLTPKNLSAMKLSPGLANMMLALTVEDWEVLFKNFSTITTKAICYVAGSTASDELAEMLLALEYDSEESVVVDEGEECDWELNDAIFEMFPGLGYEEEFLFIKKQSPIDGMLLN